jgi:hypothetical protein
MTEPAAWLIESAIHDSNGPYYLCVRTLGLVGFFDWKPDNQAAIRFGRKEDAERVRDTIKQLCPELFPHTNPMPQAVEHSWFGQREATPFRNSCNRHSDCAAATENWKRNHNGQLPGVNFHCHDEECEDCFGC